MDESERVLSAIE